MKRLKSQDSQTERRSWFSDKNKSQRSGIDRFLAIHSISDSSLEVTRKKKEGCRDGLQNRFPLGPVGSWSAAGIFVKAT